MMRQYLQIFALSTLFAIGSTYAFVVPKSTSSIQTTTTTTTTSKNSFINDDNSLFRTSLRKKAATALWANDNDDDDENDNKSTSKKGGLDETMRNKLVTESIAPWRTLRLFLYGSAGSGAFIGGLINGSGAIAGSASPDFSLQTEVCIQF
jgi:hypothetical protein